jgi:hypothetical protein
MASVTKDNQDKADAADRDRNDDPTPADRRDGDSAGPERDEVRSLENAKQTEPRTGGFFSIYKKGQGYWTRMGTLLGVTLVLFMLAYTLYAQVPAFFYGSDAAGQALGRPDRHRAGRRVPGDPRVDRAAADEQAEQRRLPDRHRQRDEEGELDQPQGADRLLEGGHLFMFFIAAFLFVMDVIFGWLMYAIDVLKLPPPPFK